eukprot:523408-Pleurochrysis_carterae.AAC.1
MSDASSVAYLRPETAQGIFTNFKNVVATGRVKVRGLREIVREEGGGEVTIRAKLGLWIKLEA